VIEVKRVDSPIGELTLAARGTRLCLLHFGNDEQAVSAFLRRWYPDEDRGAENVTAAAAERLATYFAGETTALDGIEVELNGTSFQRRVWEALRGVPAGTTASYSEIARRIGAPSAVRAVGAANGANPIAIVVPCHRVIGSGGSLTGYGGGLDRKQWLLRHEGAPGGLF
jgi:methylated-DNA-[protein]-cysteine S-methyltransferase